MSDQPRIVQVEILKDYHSEHTHFRAGEIVSIEQGFAEELILSDYAQYVDDEFDLAIERIIAAHPEAVARMIAFVDGEITAGRCQSRDSGFREPNSYICRLENRRQGPRSPQFLGRATFRSRLGGQEGNDRIRLCT